MESEPVVWNTDARYRPELEVELELECGTNEIPGRYLARLVAELEVELSVTDEDDDMIYDAAPLGYAAAFTAAN